LRYKFSKLGHTTILDKNKWPINYVTPSPPSPNINVVLVSDVLHIQSLQHWSWGRGEGRRAQHEVVLRVLVIVLVWDCFWIFQT